MQKDNVPEVDPAVPEALHRTLDLVAAGEGVTRAAIARATGLARSTVGQQVDYLVQRGILAEVETGESVRGRPPRVLGLGPAAGTIAVLDVDITVTRVAVADLTQRVIARQAVDIRIEEGPEAVLAAASGGLRRLLHAHGRDATRVRQVVVGLPGPVDFGHGCAVRPPIMPGWDGYPVSGHLREAFDAPVVVDNDVNLMALGEAAADPEDGTPLLFVRMATGVGAGLVTADGDVHRGADGAAGDIGHIRAPGHEDALCRCGKTGCVEAVASYRAVLDDLGIPESTADDPGHGSRVLAERLDNGDAGALHRIRQAATEIGHVVAMLVHVYNPRTLVLGGPLSESRDELLSGVRAVVYQQALPLATRKLVITTSGLGPAAGVRGAVALGARNVFSTDGIARILARA